MTRTIFRNTFLVGVSVLLVCMVLFFGLQYTQTKEETYNALQQEAFYAEQGLMLSGKEYLSALDHEHQITWIDQNGQVLYDSRFTDPAANQGAYPEVAEALESGEGHGIRTSDDTGEKTMYYARVCADGTVLRLSRPLSAVRDALIAVSPVLWVLVLVLLISGTLAYRAAQQIVRPINALDLDNPDPDTYPELSPLVSRLQEQALTIQDQMDALHQKQKEFSALTDSMSEGFLLVDTKATVLSANHSALRLIPDCEAGANMLEILKTGTKNTLQDALEGQRSEMLFEQEGKSWEFIANPVFSRRQLSGVVILIVDVTEREQRERLRQEFSANVSHELKTPLTSISGFAELMAQGTVPPDKVQEFSRDIYRESQRLIDLVTDIIRLSKLDEISQPPAWETVDLYQVAENTLDILRPVAEQQQISLQLTGVRAQVRGIEQLLGEMVYNLCDNGIKYNNPGGSLTVDVSQSEQAIRLSVSDTGIGIPFSLQNRVYERFYRVDKSHSQEIGGTGLGLSIVKHGAQFHGAQVELNSEPGEGTTFTLVFPLPQCAPIAEKEA